jgi:hypothetical protein
MEFCSTVNGERAIAVKKVEVSGERLGTGWTEISNVSYTKSIQEILAGASLPEVSPDCPSGFSQFPQTDSSV